MSNAVIIRPENNWCINAYIVFAFNYLRTKLQEQKVGGVFQVVNTATMESFPIPICSLAEQKLIIDLINSQFSVIDNLEQTIISSLKKSEALRQSILKKAFEGKLVSQAPDDEPAKELLKRIKEEKKKYLAEQKQQKKKEPKKTKKMSKDLSIEEVLKAANKPMPAKEVWQQSKHKGDIEEFYAELKKIQENIKEVKKGTESLLSLTK